MALEAPRLLLETGAWLSARPGRFLWSYALAVSATAGLVVVFRPPISPVLLLAALLPLLPLLYPTKVHRTAFAILLAAAAPLNWAGYTGTTLSRFAVEMTLLALACELIGWAFRVRARAIDRLGRSERRYRELVESANVIPWEFDPRTWRFTYVGPQAERLLGHPLEDWYAEGFWVAQLHPEDRDWAIAFCENATSRGEDHEFEYRFFTADGEIRWLREIVSVVSDDRTGATALRGVMVDTTERHRLDASRRELEERARTAEKIESLGLLAGGIAHDFNNLLVGILGNADLALEEMGADPRPRAAVEEILVAAGRARELTQQMLVYAGGGSAEMDVWDLAGLASASEPLLDAVVPEPVALEIRSSGAPVWVEADHAQLGVLLRSLVSNAVEAQSGRGGTIQVETGLMELPEGFGSSCVIHDPALGSRCACLEVVDDGDGMPPGVVDKIFEPFFSTRLPGRGFGLAGVLGTVRRHRGGIRVESREGEGTRIQVLLPLAKQPERGVEAPAPSAALRPPTGRTVLFVDDEETVLRVGRTALERAGFDVATARDGVEALATLDALGNEVSAVVLDMVMPRLGGREILHRIQRERPGLPVVVSSGFDERLRESDPMRPPVGAYLAKPYLPSELVACVRGLTGARPAQPPAPAP